MSYTMKRDDIFAFAQERGHAVKEHGEEIMFRYCPRCSGGDHRDEYTFSINARTGAFCCQRASCGYKGHFVELCRDFDFPLETEQARVYKRLNTPLKPIVPQDTALAYLKSRGIGEDVARRYEIFSSKKDKDTIVFPFYNEQGKLIYIKYRNTKFKPGDKGSKERSETGTMPILFGMKQCVDFERIVVTEGQMDALSVAEAGISNACSVPTGATGHTWWMPCKEWIEKFKEVVVFGDYEHGKITLVDFFKSHMPGKVKVVRKIDYLGEKDANDILRKYGPDAVRKCVENALPPVIDNVEDLADVRAVDINEVECIRTNIWNLDKVIKGLCMGTVTVLSGRRGEGKSTFASQIVCSALEQNESVFVYSGEMADYHFKRWLDCQLAGPENLIESDDGYNGKNYTIPDDVLERINAWYRGRVYILDNNYIPPEGQEPEAITDTIEKVIREYGTRLIIVDNLMTAMEEIKDQNNLYLAQSNFVRKLKTIAVKFNVAVLLVAHPRKSDGTRKIISNDDIAGSSDVTNKADNVIVLSKTGQTIGGEERTDYQNLIYVMKNRLKGVTLTSTEDAVKLIYDKPSKRFYDKTRSELPVHYGWENIKMAEEAEEGNIEEYDEYGPIF